MVAARAVVPHGSPLVIMQDQSANSREERT